jgi:hypothetical protein
MISVKREVKKSSGDEAFAGKVEDPISKWRDIQLPGDGRDQSVSGD